MNLSFEGIVLHATTADKQNMVECSQAFKKYEFRGSYKKSTQEELVGEAENVFVISGGKLKRLNPGGTNGAFRIYMTIYTKPGSPVVDSIDQETTKSIARRVIGEESEDGSTIIYDVENDVQVVDYIYDLQGRRVLEPQKGNLYIINGKKVIF